MWDKLDVAMKDECKDWQCFTQVTEEDLTVSKKDLLSSTSWERHVYFERSQYKAEDSWE